MMTVFAKFVIGGIVASALLVAYGVLRDHLMGRPEPTMDVKLGANDNTKVVVNPGKIETIERKHGTDEIVYRTQPDYGHGVEILVPIEGDVKVLPKTRGFSNDFGVTWQPKSVGVANEFFWYKQLSVLGGSQFIDIRNGDLRVNLWVGLGYRFSHKKLSNLSVYTNIDTDRRVNVGLFLRMGNS